MEWHDRRRASRVRPNPCRQEWIALVALLLALFCNAGLLHAQTTVEVLETWPTGRDIRIPANQSLYLHLRYHSQTPTHFWAAASFEGRPVKTGTNPSRVYPAGDGEAWVWFFLFEPGAKVDEIRIDAGSGSDAGTHAIASWPVRVESIDAPVSREVPAWVDAMRAADAVAEKEAQARAAAEPASFLDILIVPLFLFAVLAVFALGFLAPLWGVWRWQGGWRIGAVVALAPLAFVLARLLVDAARDATSHNLWPFEIVLYGAPGAVLMLALLLFRRWLARRGQ